MLDYNASNPQAIRRGRKLHGAVVNAVGIALHGYVPPGCPPEEVHDLQAVAWQLLLDTGALRYLPGEAYVSAVIRVATGEVTAQERSLEHLLAVEDTLVSC